MAKRSFLFMAGTAANAVPLVHGLVLRGWSGISLLQPSLCSTEDHRFVPTWHPQSAARSGGQGWP